AVAFKGVAQRRRQGIDQAALDAVFADDELTLTPQQAALAIGTAGYDGLERLPGKTCAEELAPVGLEAAVGRFERCQRDVSGSQHVHPGAVRSQACPAAAAEREEGGRRFCRGFARRRGETQRSVCRPALPAMPNMDGDAGL